MSVASCARSALAESCASDPYEFVVPYSSVETASSLVVHAIVATVAATDAVVTLVIAGDVVSVRIDTTGLGFTVITASAVAVPALPEIVVWSPVFVPEILASPAKVRERSAFPTDRLST